MLYTCRHICSVCAPLPAIPQYTPGRAGCVHQESAADRRLGRGRAGLSGGYCAIQLQDGVETVLLDLVLLFSPDMLDLLERRMVEEIQTKFALLLQKYLTTK